MANTKSRDIEAPGPEVALAGTLLLPSIGETPCDTVLILPGSGPIDRNGNIPGIVTTASYQLFAERLATHGIASVRIDKRGLGEAQPQMIRFDPAAALHELGEREAPLTVVMVHGGLDIQIADEDARALADARPDAELIVIPDMNHVLKRVVRHDRDVNLATYTNPQLPIVPGVLDAVVEFVVRTCQSR